MNKRQPLLPLLLLASTGLFAQSTRVELFGTLKTRPASRFPPPQLNSKI
jgi:hypothetical protein